MGDPMTFETRLANAFERYLADAPVEVDPITVAARVVSESPRRTFGWVPLMSTHRRRLALALVVGLIALALTATALLIIGRFQHRPSLPLVYRNELVAAPNLLKPRAFTDAVTLLDGRVLIVGGDDSFAPTAEVFDPTDGSVDATGKLVGTGNLSVGRMALLRDGRVLLLGEDLRTRDARVPCGRPAGHQSDRRVARRPRRRSSAGGRRHSDTCRKREAGGHRQ